MSALMYDPARRWQRVQDVVIATAYEWLQRNTKLSIRTLLHEIQARSAATMPIGSWVVLFRKNVMVIRNSLETRTELRVELDLELKR